MRKATGALTTMALFTAIAAQAQLDTNGLQQVPLDQLPDAATYWLLKGPCPSIDGSPQPPLPFIPPDLANLNLPIYSLGDNNLLIDDSSVSYEALEATHLLMSMEDEVPRPPGEGGGTNDYGAGIAGAAATTNDLWLEITGFTNHAASLVVHPPWNDTNLTHDLYFRTNLDVNPTSAFSLQWSRIQRSAPGHTNLVVTNLLSDQGFLRLGPTTNAVRPGFTNYFLERNDDNYCCGVNGAQGTSLTNLLATLPFAINFFGSTNSSLYVNNNGNVTFGGPRPEYTPDTPLVDLRIKIIAPFWADVDTRNTNSDVVRFGTNSVDGHTAFGVDWVNVGYFVPDFGGADELLSCQLVIIDRSDIATNDFDMEFNYDRVEWQWGAASVGYPPRAGYADGGTNSYELPYSADDGAFIDSNFDTGLIYHSLDGPRTNLLSSPVSGRYRFSFRNGEPLP